MAASIAGQARGLARLLALCLLVLTAVPRPANARCPFAHLWEHDEADGAVAGHARALLQRQPPFRPPGGGGGGSGGGGGGGGPQNPPQNPPQQPPQQPPQPVPPCNLAALIAAGPYVPPGPASQGEVDAHLKEIAWTVVTEGATQPLPVAGLGKPGAPNQAQPIGACLRLAFHDAGTYNR